MTYAIEDYYAKVDSGRLEEATAMLAVDVEFAMVLPTGVNLGHGRSAMLDYLTGRPKVDRKHVLRRVAADGDALFAYGDVTEQGGSVTTGHFVGAMHVGPDGLIDRYQVSFSPEFALLPADSPAER
ncbi:nuclear transport factor 2 family protein [Nocardia higoensis]|uniref:nuclear transport factor 2 family protein n=1 Tax=Nocardia higoensis TaxID=228599 RepID=UPI0002DFFB7E|nr:nuclear transport factor 2 family protein [Nocardia higoensis]